MEKPSNRATDNLGKYAIAMRLAKENPEVAKQFPLGFQDVETKTCQITAPNRVWKILGMNDDACKENFDFISVVLFTFVSLVEQVGTIGDTLDIIMGTATDIMRGRGKPNEKQK